MRKRGLIFVTVMSIITFGIYDIYWAFSTRNELVKKGCKVFSPLVILAPLLALLVVVLIQILIHNGNTNESLVTTSNVLSVLVGILGFLAIIPMLFIWLWRYSQAVGKVTKGELSAEVSMVVAIISTLTIGIVWPIVVQYYYNKIPSKT